MKTNMYFYCFGRSQLEEARQQYGQAMQVNYLGATPTREPLYLLSVPVETRAFWGEETNPYADSETAGDGGGYYQPAGGVSLHLPTGEDVIVEYEDRSCGDFGTREFWKVTAPGLGFCWRWNEGTMEDASIDSDEEIEAVKTSIWGVLGLAPDEVTSEVRRAVYAAAYDTEVDIE